MKKKISKKKKKIPLPPTHAASPTKPPEDSGKFAVPTPHLGGFAGSLWYRGKFHTLGFWLDFYGLFMETCMPMSAT